MKYINFLKYDIFSKNNLKTLLSSLIITAYPLIAYSAVLLEPVETNPEVYQAKHFLLEQSTFAPLKLLKPIELKTDPPIEAKIKLAPISNPKNKMALYQGSILTAQYQKIDLAKVKDITSKYESIPGGVTLEGTALGIGAIKSLTYHKESNQFIINEKIKYPNPVSSYEFKLMLQALQEDNRVGVSLGETNLIYGQLREGSLTAISLKLADHFLGSISFAQPRWVRFHQFPNGYTPKPHTQSGGLYAVYFNFTNFEFKKDDAFLSLSKAGFIATLIPLTKIKTADGGYLPDYEKIEGSRLPREYESNIQHIVKNISYYENDSRLQHVIKYGEAAAFIRFLLKQGIKELQI